MTKYIIRRLLMIIPVLLGAVIIVFTINFFSTTDPAMIKLGLNAKDEVKLAETREERASTAPILFSWATMCGSSAMAILATPMSTPRACGML